jgi:hypothetical protein
MMWGRIRASDERVARSAVSARLASCSPVRRIRASGQRIVRPLAVTRAVRTVPHEIWANAHQTVSGDGRFGYRAERERRGSNRASLRLVALAGRANTAEALHEIAR